MNVVSSHHPPTPVDEESKIGHYRVHFDPPRGRERRRSAGVGSRAVSGWFTEGFDTQDLKEAKGLIDSLIIT